MDNSRATRVSCEHPGPPGSVLNHSSFRAELLHSGPGRPTRTRKVQTMDSDSSTVFLGVMASDGWKLHAPLARTEQPLQDWGVEPECGELQTLSDSESEGVLHAIDPNEVFSDGLPTDPSTNPSSEGDIAKHLSISTATTQLAPSTIYQVVYDTSGVGGATTGVVQENVISIELDEWSSQLMLSNSCIVNELPVLSALRPAATAAAIFPDPSDPNDDLLFADLQLTEEEQKLLTQEGVSLPNNLPLTKAEEQILKKVRRKIRNKQSAQDSRRRRKEYIDGLESRAAACSAQNRELQRTVEKLEKHNMYKQIGLILVSLENFSLLAQLRQLQSLIRQTVSKGAQTSTCLLIILVSLSLIILPSFGPFSRRLPTDDDYRPTGVISRNILTDPSSSQLVENDLDPPTARSDPLRPLSDLNQSARVEGGVGLQEPIENLQNSTFDGTTHDDRQSGDSLTGQQVDPVVMTGGLDAAPPAHADEM